MPCPGQRETSANLVLLYSVEDGLEDLPHRLGMVPMRFVVPNPLDDPCLLIRVPGDLHDLVVVLNLRGLHPG